MFQLISNLDFYDVPFPYITFHITFELKKIVDFYYLNPEKAIQIIYSEFTLMGYITDINHPINNVGDRSAMLADYNNILCLAALMLAALMFLLLSAIIFRDWATIKLK